MPGSPLTVDKAGSDVALTWDAATCSGAEVNVYVGAMGDFSTFTSGHCGLSPSGSATVNVPDNSWFLVASTDGVDTDGSWSRDHWGNELSYSGSGAVCPEIVSHAPGGVCF